MPLGVVFVVVDAHVEKCFESRISKYGKCHEGENVKSSVDELVRSR